MALVVIAYANSIHGEFVYDDIGLIPQNADLLHVHTLGDAWELVRNDQRVLLLGTYALNYLAGGLNVEGYHAVNIATHALNAILVYLIMRTLASTFLAFAGAAVFAVHPIFTDAVASIAGRSSLLCATFYFLAVWLFLQFLTTKHRLPLLFIPVTAYAAWLTKQEAIALPLMLSGLALMFISWRSSRWVLLICGFGSVAVLAVLRNDIAHMFTMTTQNPVLVAAGFDPVPAFGLYFRTYITALVDYVFPRLLWPAALSVDPYIPQVAHWYSPEFLVSLSIIAALAVLLARTKTSLLRVGVAALLLSPLLAYAAIPLADVVMEHRIYIPGLSVAFLAAWGLSLVKSYRRLALTAVLVALTLTTAERNKVWANSITLWQDAIEKGPLKARAHFNLAETYQDLGRNTEALKEYSITIALKPDVYAAYSNIAALQLDAGQLDAAEAMLLKTTRLAPQFPEGFINLGVLYLRQKRPGLALDALNEAVRLRPDHYMAYANRGDAYTALKAYPEALSDYRRAVEIRPDFPFFHLMLGLAYARTGNRPEAVTQLTGLTGTPYQQYAAQFLKDNSWQ